ncbi:MAG: phosphoribosylanthranilate isomerase [Burkholderiaceae bacterium]
MRTRIKFCGLVREEDVDAAVELAVDAVGFVFYPRSPRYVEPAHARRLRRRLPSFVSAVGLFVNEPAHEAARIADEVGLDVVQFHGDETPRDCLRTMASVRATSAWWRAVRMRGPADLLESTVRFDAAEAFLLDKHGEAYGGAGEAFDWRWVTDAAPAPRQRRLILAGGLSPETVGEAIRQVRPFAVDVSSGIQTNDPRCKSLQKMKAFVRAVEQADARAWQADPEPDRRGEGGARSF